MEVVELGEDIVFSTLERLSSDIFVSREVLRPDYVPESLPHREREIKALTEHIAPIIRGERPSNIFIYGLTGTGKTAVVKYVTNRVSQFAAKKGLNHLSIAYVNCRHEDTTYRALTELALSLGVKVPFTGLSTAEVFKRFKEALNRAGNVLVAVLDEVDFLVKKNGDDLLYRLTRINSELRGGKVSLIGITNDVRFTETLDPRVKSSLGEVEMVFSPYDADQLRDILMERASRAFKPGVLEDGVIDYCASIAAREHGDARRALDLLRVAGEIAERENAKKVTVRHVKEARYEIERNMIIDVAKTLPFHGKLVLLVIALGGGKFNSTGDLYIKYRELARGLGAEPVTQRRVSDIISELDMLGIVTARVINRGRYGKTREVVLNVDPNTLIKAFKDDARLAWIFKNDRY
ncbi:MAG: orc1/cdc6 family replication initiation protein [Desulfurococcales archaeon]|nr:orc1/cdc6 family replication initiation protein [Desulfurococcales archaeon]